jgi:O-antigen ligase
MMPAVHTDTQVLAAAEHLATRWDRVLLAGVCLALGFAVVAMGAVQPWTVFFLRSAAAVLFLLWAIAQVLQGSLRLTRSAIYAPALAFAGLVLLQMLSGVTAYRHDTLVELLNYVSYGLLAFVVLQCLQGSQATNSIAMGFTAFGLASAVFALLQYFAPNGKLFWLVQVPVDAPIFGSYVNHNHYAGLMEMLIAFPLVFALQSQVSLAKRLFFAFAATVMAVSVVESGSRGGMIAIGCQIVLLAFIGRFTRMKRGAALALLLMLAAMAVLLAIVADSGVLARVSSLREPGRSDVTGWRMELNRDSLAMLRARPILGWGLGAYPTVYPQFRSFYDDAPINEAHDDYLQLLAETGVVGGVITVWFLVVLFRDGWRNLRAASNSWDKGVTLAAIISVSGILIHSASDFNLHIPGNAAIFFVICAFVVAPLSRRGERSGGEPPKKGKLVIPSEVRPLAQVEEFPQRLRVVVRRY